MVSAAEEYLESRVMTAPPERLHLLVVEAALRFSKIGAQALRDSNFERSFAALSKARDCVNELLCSVRTDTQPDLGNQLKGLFLFCHRSLFLADLEHAPGHADDAIRVLQIHRETWVELLDRLAREGGGLQPASAPAPLPGLLTDRPPSIAGGLSAAPPTPPRRLMDPRFDDDTRSGLDLTS